MKFEDLKLSAGLPVQLQLPTTGAKPQRYPCKLIGYLQGKGILVTPPVSSGKLVRLIGGQKLMVRLMVANGMCVFNASVETISTSPYPVLYLSYPNNVSFKGVRNATRVDVRLPVFARNDGDLELSSLQGVIADISVTGARLELTGAIGEIGDELLLSAEVRIAAIDKVLEVRAIIRSRIERSTREYDEKLPAVYGVEFIEKDEDKLMALYAYVYVEMANESLFD